MSKEFGFVAEPHKNGWMLVSPASKEGEKITCHDLSGFLGNWDMKEGGVFFPSVTGSSLCPQAMELATEYANKINYKEIK